jgi:hypothetical protein
LRLIRVAFERGAGSLVVADEAGLFALVREDVVENRIAGPEGRVLGEVFDAQVRRRVRDPESGGSAPASTRRRVVLPDPLTPIRAMRSRSSTEKPTSWNRTFST